VSFAFYCMKKSARGQPEAALHAISIAMPYAKVAGARDAPHHSAAARVPGAACAVCEPCAPAHHAGARPAGARRLRCGALSRTISCLCLCFLTDEFLFLILI
jgi:hypothetical protein